MLVAVHPARGGCIASHTNPSETARPRRRPPAPNRHMTRVQLMPCRRAKTPWPYMRYLCTCSSVCHLAPDATSLILLLSLSSLLATQALSRTRPHPASDAPFQARPPPRRPKTCLGCQPTRADPRAGGELVVPSPCSGSGLATPVAMGSMLAPRPSVQTLPSLVGLLHRFPGPGGRLRRQDDENPGALRFHALSTSRHRLHLPDLAILSQLILAPL